MRLGLVSTGGRFSAIGNTFLLKKPTLLQVQCSRSDFGYRRVRNAKGAFELVKDAKGNKVVDFATAAFDEKLGDLLAAAKHGAVLVSPCVSDGEKEIAARAFAAGASVVALQNKGFSPLYKPGGQLFERCAFSGESVLGGLLLGGTERREGNHRTWVLHVVKRTSIQRSRGAVGAGGMSGGVGG